MANYPKIYSLCTVGVRQHYNTEYPFHEVRTDFTGGNGLGKSIIADLMQLIIVPRRDMWKPGTEGIGKDERRVEGIPLNKEYIQFAYAYMNIERKEGQFITIGVFISKTPRIPVRPFIIQGNSNFDGALTPFSRPLHPADFMNGEQTIFDLKELGKHFTANHSLYVKDFFQTDGIMQYYDLLYKNNILPVNLTKPENLRTYAKVIQSFARAKSLDITNSRSLQNFLFEDNEEIKKTFEEQKDQLHSLVRQYRENHFHTQELQQKQRRLLSLLETNKKSTATREEFLKSSAAFASQKYTNAQTRHENNIKHIEGSSKNLKIQKEELKKVTEDLYISYTNLQKVCVLLREQYEVLLQDFSDETIQDRKKSADLLRDKLNRITSLYPIVKQYGTVEKVQNKLNEQYAFKAKKASLNKILSLYSLPAFEQSLWATDNFTDATRHYNEKLAELPQQIEELETLVELFEGTRDDSFFHWAIQNNSPLTKEQESVLMYLKELSTAKPTDASTGTRYIANPAVLLNCFETDGENGLWITFGELREYAPLVTKQRFTNTKNLKTVLEKDTKEIKLSLQEARQELRMIQRLSDELTAIGFNQELTDIWKQKDEIRNYVVDNTLNEEKIELIKENWDDILQTETLQLQFASIENEAIDLAKRQTEIKSKMNSTKQAYNTCEYEFTKLKLESSVEVEIADVDYSEKSLEELNELKSNFDSTLKSRNEQKNSSEKYILTAEGELRGYRSSEPILKQQTEEALIVFNEKKEILKAETGIIFEPSLITGELNEHVVDRMERKSEDLLEAYHEEFTRTMEAFDETKGDKCPELVVDKFNFHTLVKVLCGKLGLEGLGPELERLNEELKKFGDLQLTIIIDVFKKVELQYNQCRKLITELNFFFKENRISGVYNFQIDFNDRKDITVDWIRRMREQAKHNRLSSKLFITAENEVSPENLILNIAKSFSDVGDCDIYNLLDAKFYFDLRVGLFDEQGNRYPGSGGEAYTCLALLCIGRMSVIQRDKNRPGVRFIIIEELSNIDDTNFGLFPEIAKMFSYQLLTMTPKPFGAYTESEWYLHMLIRGKDKNINYQPMSFFRTKNSKQRLEEYMGDGKIETLTPITISASTDEDVTAAPAVVNLVEVATVVEEIPTLFSETTTETEVTAITENEDQVVAEIVESFIDAVTDSTIEETPAIEAISETEIEMNVTTEEVIGTVSDEVITDEIPDVPQMSDSLPDVRKEEFLGLSEESTEEAGKTDEDKSEGSAEEDNSPNII